LQGQKSTAFRDIIASFPGVVGLRPLKKDIRRFLTSDVSPIYAVDHNSGVRHAAVIAKISSVCFLRDDADPG